jgi:CheY-like chemotaxis protein
MCTAYIVEDLIRKALEEGAYAVINKPFRMDFLLRSIANARKQSGIGGVILFADQDEALCDDVNRLLTTHGHHVVVAHDGVVALEEAEKRAFDIVFVEDDLPRGGGLEVHRRIKAKQNGVLATIVLTSSRESPPLARRKIPREEGLTALAKPLDKAQLLELVESICAAERL